MEIVKVNDLLQIGTVVFTLLAAACGVGAYFTGKSIQKDYSKKIENIEKEQTGRVLSNDQIHLLITSFRQLHHPKLPIFIMGLQGNTESIHLAESIKQALIEASYHVDGVWEDNLIGGTGPGILIRQKSLDGVIGIGIKAALNQVKLESKIVQVDKFDSEKIEIIVGYKPK